ncbi:DUF6221 family protein [Phycicoccus jejuensis]|uniref:DUF6221 family protein n=1 Tax=Phycicoccus jejuensis TaxID=367299 RepID=UPI00384DAD86
MPHWRLRTLGRRAGTATAHGAWSLPEPTRTHVLAHGPKRVLAGVKAQRRIVQEAETMTRHAANVETPSQLGAYALACRGAVRMLAATWADHPDYDKTW